MSQRAWHRAVAAISHEAGSEPAPPPAPREIRALTAGGILAIQNLAIFAGHYAGILGFPWDFNGTYYAVPAWWMSAVRHGILPRWIPFSAGGYPFALNLQSGFFYPPFWIFPALGIPFTLHAAVAVQCLHVLLGAAGMYVLLRLALESRWAPIVGAAAFQLFGGFYSNAEHADIVRAFALLPWLLFTLTRAPRDGALLPARAFLLPPVLYLLATGGYPFNFLAALLVGAVYGAAEILRLPGSPRRMPRIAGLAAAYAGLGALGVGMAFVQLAPAWSYRADLARWHTHVSLPSTGIGWRELPGLVFRSTALPGEISMTSTYVPLLLLAAAFLLPASEVRRRAGFLVLLVSGAVMAAGRGTPIYDAVAGLIPVFGVSRFPASDYRAFIAIAAIALGAAAFEAAARGDVSRRRFLSGTALASAGFAWCAWRVRGSVGTLGVGAAALSLGLALVLLALASRRARGLAGPLAALALLLVCADGARFLFRQDTWWLRDPAKALPPSVRPPEGPVAPDVFRPLPARPERASAPAGNFAGSGYLTGEFGVYEVETAVLERLHLADRSDAHCRFLRRGWEPHLVDLAFSRAGGPGEGPGVPDWLVDEPPADPALVRQLEYGPSEIAYTVDLPRPALLVENELFFPGWRARLDAAPAEIDAVAVNGVFRGWILPAGRHHMTAAFRFPRMTLYALASAACWSLWIALIASPRTRRRTAVPG